MKLSAPIFGGEALGEGGGGSAMFPVGRNFSCVNLKKKQGFFRAPKFQQNFLTRAERAELPSKKFTFQINVFFRDVQTIK